MGLELALGRPIGPMSERTFAIWRHYSSIVGLPPRRIEYAIAFGAMRIAQAISGSEGLTIEDFVIPANLFVLADADPDISQAWDAFGLTAEERERVKNG